MLGHGHLSHIVKMHYFLKNLLYSQALSRQTEGIMMIGDQWRVYQSCKFNDPWSIFVLRHDHIGHVVKMQFFYSWAWIKQITCRCTVMMTKEGSTMVILIIPGQGFLCRVEGGGGRGGGLKLCIILMTCINIHVQYINCLCIKGL